jgi:uncharacterized protein
MSKLNGKFFWFENVAADPDRAKGFYGELFGWTIQSLPMGTDSYDMITNAGKPIGGYTRAEGKTPSHWTSYLRVEDVDASVAKVKAAGGQVIEAAFDVPTVGRMAKVADPQGATFWVMRGENDEVADGAPAVGRFDWNELWARDAAKAVGFYTKVFGHTSREMPMEHGAYHILSSGGEDRAGVMTASRPDVPPMWLPYVTVADTDTTASRAVKLGGKVHLPPTDIPNVGRFAVLGDPNGATIAVIKLSSVK